MSSYVKNILLTLNRQFLSLIVGTLTSIIIARYLGIEDRGIYALIVLLPMTIFTLSNFGINSSVVYYTGKKTHSIEEMIQSLKLLTIVTIIISITIGLFVIILYKEMFFKEVATSYLFVGLLFLPSLIYNSFFQSIFIGHEDFKTFNFILLLQPVIFLVLLIINLVLDYNIKGVLASELIAQYSTFILTYIYIKKEYGTHHGRPSKSLMLLKLKYGLKSHLTNILAFLDYRLDLFMVTYYLDLKAVGAYVIAVNIAEKLWMVSTSVSSVMFARIANMVDNNEKNLITIYSAKVVFIISLIIGITLYFLAEKLIVLLFGQEYSASVLPFLYLLPGIVLGAVSRVYANYIGGQGKPEYNLYVVIILVIENFILNMILIPKFGLAGAAMATSIAYATNFIFKILVFKWMSKVTLVEILLPTPYEINIVKTYIKQRKKNAK